MTPIICIGHTIRSFRSPYVNRYPGLAYPWFFQQLGVDNTNDFSCFCNQTAFNNSLMCFSVKWRSSGRYFRSSHRTDSAPSHNRKIGATSTWGSLPRDTTKQLLYVCRRASYFYTVYAEHPASSAFSFWASVDPISSIPHHLILDGYDGWVV